MGYQKSLFAKICLSQKHTIINKTLVAIFSPKMGEQPGNYGPFQVQNIMQPVNADTEYMKQQHKDI